MTDTVRYTKGKSMEELLETQRTSVVGGDVHQAVSLEIQRIQQDTNNIQIANLIEEVKKLKDIADSNAESSKLSAISSNKLSRTALIIAGVTLLAQVIFSSHQELFCAGTSSVAGDSAVYYHDCHRRFEFGLLGAYEYQVADFVRLEE